MPEQENAVAMVSVIEYSYFETVSAGCHGRRQTQVFDIDFFLLAKLDNGSCVTVSQATS